MSTGQRTLSFIITGPPTLDAGSFVSIVDDATGQRIDASVGWWWHDGQYHRFTMPYEFAPRLVTAPPESSISESITRVSAKSPELQQIIDESDAIALRKRRRSQIDGAKRKEAPTAAPADNAPAPAHWERCPSCTTPIDPSAHELMDCGNCGESKCTAACLPNPVRPCVDCQALDGAAEEQEQVAAPPSGRLFDNQFRPDPREVAKAQEDSDLEIREDED